MFAVKTAGAADGADVAALTPEKVELLRGIFWDMCTVSSEIKTVEHPASGDTAAWSEEVLFISISAKTAEEMRTTYALTEFQSQSLNELLAQMDTLGSLLGDLTISQADALELLQALPADLAPDRRAVVETACKLVGKVNYFWGGKSLVLGWDSRWGTLREVTAAGNSTTDTYRPYGLDCSGFVDWVFYNITGGEYVIGHGGGAHAQHTYCTAISWEEAQPGDLVFYPEDSHVGIVGGRDENGNLLIVHCASGANNVVITGLEGFTSIGRPLYYRV
ncbi:C40 family peptidase [Flavonifractor sp. An52]|uniref:C40 family peptidase n=1 Tax=Flavonifractor sp. An52 TaxID=1965642 RepID=UPI001FA8ECF7|nr:NlpC/P60 family protein [Flavonifractor sp. An52]